MTRPSQSGVCDDCDGDDLRERLLQWVAACGCFCEEDRQRDSLDDHEMQCPARVEHMVTHGGGAPAPTRAPTPGKPTSAQGET